MREEKEHPPRLKNCACRNLRMTARVITQYYDEAMRPSGLKPTQFTLLNEIASSPSGISVGELAEKALMDQTTVTRNVEILCKKGYLDIDIDAADQRKKRIQVNAAGRAKLIDALPFWEKAQRKLEDHLGDEDYAALLQMLAALRQMK